MIQFGRIVCATILGLNFTTFIAAQETEPTSDQQMTEPTAVGTAENTTDSKTATQLALASCTSDKAQLVLMLSSMASLEPPADSCGVDDAQLQLLQEEITFCKEDRQQARRSNLNLNDRLEACTSFSDDPKENEATSEMSAEVNRLANQLTARTDELRVELDKRLKAETRVVQLEARLAAFEISPDPGFSYLGDNARLSLTTAKNINSLRVGIPRLSVKQCEQGLDWMIAQDGSQKALRRVIWVWENDVPNLCARDRTGQMIRLAPRNNSDAAHIVIFE